MERTKTMKFRVAFECDKEGCEQEVIRDEEMEMGGNGRMRPSAGWQTIIEADAVQDWKGGTWHYCPKHHLPHKHPAEVTKESADA